ncbi:hypothetical protein HYALB_00010376 [Hymenoscyphus albidus]|uniref:Uncharacterized protein n=1 Tax=Hymenoscyphus albidus TaxID=595503 RepID=A0A9N9LN89_9HELO|nr:hypothetical protein HYALB_00010376 [Hymenoscyphus albidus]
MDLAEETRPTHRNDRPREWKGLRWGSGKRNQDGDGDERVADGRLREGGLAMGVGVGVGMGVSVGVGVGVGVPFFDLVKLLPQGLGLAACFAAERWDGAVDQGANEGLHGGEAQEESQPGDGETSLPQQPGRGGEREVEEEEEEEEEDLLVTVDRDSDSDSDSETSDPHQAKQRWTRLDNDVGAQRVDMRATTDDSGRGQENGKQLSTRPYSYELRKDKGGEWELWPERRGESR